MPRLPPAASMIIDRVSPGCTGRDRAGSGFFFISGSGRGGRGEDMGN